MLSTLVPSEDLKVLCKRYLISQHPCEAAKYERCFTNQETPDRGVSSKAVVSRRRTKATF